MIILDTNVISAMMAGDCAVVTWVMALGEQPVTTAITAAELLYGIEQLPDGARRRTLRSRSAEALSLMREILPFTTDSADVYAAIRAERRRGGRPIATMDAMIAAITRQTGAGLATRNVADFEGLGLRLVDPWSAEG
ncbi:hypothetical protein AXK60_17770 [Tsukamurella pseudospumae]|uniref:Ribonuclease VapC n=1 Tax=Tsukamurella pseudospumae TaxID=239498 RepID=A0A137ZZS1_9ACTN|nr:hypothetical protein AXK60_17770 [Tsukamurella pseudospumae]